MSKLSPNHLQAAIAELLQYALVEKPRHFVEKVDIQIALKGYDTAKDKRFAGHIVLPHVIRPHMSICYICDLETEAAAKRLGVATQTMDELRKLDRNRGKVKRFGKSFDAFLASDSVIRTIPRILGPGLARLQKFPTVVSKGEDVLAKCDELKRKVKFQLKRHPHLACSVANVAMTPEQILANATMAINFLISLCKKGWHNIQALYIKSTMGPAIRLM